jgi:hypothetical protein
MQHEYEYSHNEINYSLLSLGEVPHSNMDNKFAFISTEDSLCDPLDLNLSHLKPVQNLTQCFYEVNFNSSLHLHNLQSGLFFHSNFLTKILYEFSFLL